VCKNTTSLFSCLLFILFCWVVFLVKDRKIERKMGGKEGRNREEM
jgi:hypothetical protein